MASSKEIFEGIAPVQTSDDAPQNEYLNFSFVTSLPMAVPASSLYPKQPSAPVSPFDWSSNRKAFTTCLSCLVTVVSGYTSGSLNAAVPGMEAEWNKSETALLLGTTTYCIGFALAPMILAPLSEIKGRKPIFMFSSFVFTSLLFLVQSAVSRD